MYNIVTSLFADAYKYGHYFQYPEGTQYVFCNWTGRKFRDPSLDRAVCFGLQYVIKYWLQYEFNENFFKLPWEYVEGRMKHRLTTSLGMKVFAHFKALHELGYLPIKIYALPEGSLVGPNVPEFVMVNTDERFFWLPNFLETLISAELWGPANSATVSRQYRKIGTKWAKEYYGSDANLTPVDYQFHDFSMRGMFGISAALISGMGHLTQSLGTDTLAAIDLVEQYYGKCSGGSIAATEHSVMCAGGKVDEFGTFRRLIKTVYPEGPLSIVSDTWDLWKVVTKYVEDLKHDILNRKGGPIVFRPDSGNPELIVCGDPNSADEFEKKGVLRLLAERLGTTNGMINNALDIYGEGISPVVADKILERIVREIKLSPYNQVFGVGSYSFQYNTRDTLGKAMKATASIYNGVLYNLFKDPATDKSGLKKSHEGIVVVHKDQHGNYYYEDQQPEYMLDCCAFNKVFENGNLLMGYSFDDVRKRARC